MAFRWGTSLDFLQTAHIPTIFTAYANAAIQSLYARRGNALKISAGGYARKTLTAKDTWIVGFGVRLDSLINIQTLLKLHSSGTDQVFLNVNTDGTCSLWRYHSSTPVELERTIAQKFTAEAFCFVEMKCLVGNSGSWEVRVNGVTILEGTGDTDNTGSGTANAIEFGPADYNNIYFDDIYVCDGDGTYNNDFLGDGRMAALCPVGNGEYSDFVGSDSNSVDNYKLVRDSVAPVLCTVDPATETFTSAAHGLEVGNIIAFTAPDSGGVLPTGLVVDTDYYVIAKDANTFTVSTSAGGSLRTVSDDGTGNIYFHRRDMPDGELSYVVSDTPGDMDTYPLDPITFIGADSAIDAVQLSVLVKKTAAGDKTIRPIVRIGTTDYEGDNFNPSDASYTMMTQVYERTPEAVPEVWTPERVNAAEFGFEVVV